MRARAARTPRRGAWRLVSWQLDRSPVRLCSATFALAAGGAQLATSFFDLRFSRQGARSASSPALK